MKRHESIGRSGIGAASVLEHLNSGTRENPNVQARLARDELFEAWQNWESRLDEKKRALRWAVEAYINGTGPDPSALLDEVIELRTQAASVCRGLLWSCRDERRED